MFSAAVGVHMLPVICRDDISRGGNVDFSIFCISPVGETQFLPISAFRPWAKRSFCRFLHFARGRNVVFAVFCISPVGETQILPSSAFRPWTKRRFCRFLYFRHGGNVDFADFCISAMAETSFFSFSARPSSRTDKNREIWH